MATVETRLEGTISVPNWTVQPGTLRSDGGTNVTTDAAGNIYLTGYTEGYFAGTKSGETTLNNDAFVVKYNSSGQEIWRQQIGNPSLDDQPYDIAVDAAGNVYLTGSTYDALPASGGFGGYSDAFLAKFSSTGQPLWQKRFGSEKNDAAHALVLDTSGNVYVTGESKGYSSNNFQGGDAFLTKFDGNGTQAWSQTIDQAASDIGYGLAIDAANNIYVAGETGGILQGTQPGEKDSFVAKYDINGNQQWLVLPTAFRGFDQALDVAVDGTGNVYLTGTIAELGLLSFKRDIYALKLTPAGQMTWMQRFDEGSDEHAVGIEVDASNNIYLAGQTKKSLFGGYMGGIDVVLVKLDGSGSRLGLHQSGTLANDLSNGITVDPVGNILVAGVTMGTLGLTSQGNNDAFLIKYGNTPLPLVNPTNPTNPVTPVGKTLRGTVRSEVLQGDAGNDVLLGMQGNDRLLGLEGNDRLMGGSGRDQVMGGAGNDALDGGPDNDRLMGGTGADQFVLSKGKGFDTILDFQRGEDQMILPRGVSARQIDMTQVGRRTLISYGEDVLAVLTGRQPNPFSLGA